MSARMGWMQEEEEGHRDPGKHWEGGGGSLDVEVVRGQNPDSPWGGRQGGRLLSMCRHAVAGGHRVFIN